MSVKKLLPCFVIVMMLSFVACSHPKPRVGAVRYDEAAARRLFDITNQTRKARDVPPLKWSDTLAGYGQAWSVAMAEKNCGDCHSDLPDGIVAENVGVIAPDPSYDYVSREHYAFMHSPEHRFNVLDGRLKTLGIGIVISNGKAWITEEFGLTGGFKVEAPDRPSPGPTCSPIVKTSCRYRIVPD